MTVCTVVSTFKGINKLVCPVIKFKTLSDIRVLFVEPYFVEPVIIIVIVVVVIIIIIMIMMFVQEGFWFRHYIGCRFHSSWTFHR